MSAYMYETHGHDRARLRSYSVNNLMDDPSRATLGCHPAITLIAALLLLIVALNISLLLITLL